MWENLRKKRVTTAVATTISDKIPMAQCYNYLSLTLTVLYMFQAIMKDIFDGYFREELSSCIAPLCGVMSTDLKEKMASTVLSDEVSELLSTSLYRSLQWG